MWCYTLYCVELMACAYIDLLIWNGLFMLCTSPKYPNDQYVHIHVWNVSLAVWQKAEMCISMWKCTKLWQGNIILKRGGESWSFVYDFMNWNFLLIKEFIWSFFDSKLLSNSTRRKHVLINASLWTLLIIVHVTASLWHSAFYLQAEKPLTSMTEHLPMSWEALHWTEKRYYFY